VGGSLPGLDVQPPRSHSLLMRLRRNLWVELGLYAAALCLCGVMGMQIPSTAARIYDVTVGICLVAIIFKLYQVIRRIDAHLQSDTSVREHLASLLDILQAYSRKYLYLSVGFVPLFVLYAVLLEFLFPTSAAGRGGASSGTADAPVWVFVTVAVVLTLLLTGLCYLLSRAYIWWMFGKYIRRLRETLQHFDKAPDA
jgi:hypothetical protein